MGSRARVELGLAVLVMTAVVLYAVGDDELTDNLLYLGVMAGASVAAWIGAVRASAEHRLVAGLIAAGVSLTFLGDTVWEVLDARGGAPDVSVADPLWGLSYLALGAALVVVLRRSGAGGRDDLAFLVDAATIAAVSIMVFWSASIGAILADPALTTQAKLVYAVYPVADAVLLALVLRVLTSPPARAALDRWFGLGICLWLVADTLWLQSPTGRAEIVMDALWMVAPVLMARAAWRLDAATVAARPSPGRHSRTAQLGVAVGPLMVPPVLLYVAVLRDRPHQPTLLVVGSAVLTALAFTRMVLLVRAEEQALRELEAARDAALEASRAKSMFLATMSHEIRTPLTMVLGTAELLEDTPLGDMQRDLVGRMQRNGRMLRALVDNVLDFSRIEAGHLELQPVEFDLHDLLADVVEFYAPRAALSGIDFECHADPAVSHRVVGDPDRLLQVLSNLLDNALKFTHEGAVRLHVRPVAAPDPGTAASGVELAVSDTGIGIREDQLASVFESFNQLDGSMTRRYGGSGLGLAICQQLVELMGGTVTVASELGRGSVFTARVPLAPPTEGQVVAAADVDLVPERSAAAAPATSG